MRSSVIVVKYALVLLGAVGFMALGATASKVGAADSVVDVRVCGAESAATISILTPKGDSTISRQPISLSGKVQDVSQVTVMVDGSYSHSFAIARDQTDYQTSVTVSAGTHTIEVVGSDVCGLSDPSNGVVVTYSSATPPSSGGDIPTDVGSDPSAPSGGVVVSDQPSVLPSVRDDNNRLSSPDWLAKLPAPIRWGVEAVDLHTVARDGIITGTVRVLAVLTGFAGIVGPNFLVAWLRPEHVHGQPSLKTLLIIQLSGLGLITLALIV